MKVLYYFKIRILKMKFYCFYLNGNDFRLNGNYFNLVFKFVVFET